MCSGSRSYNVPIPQRSDEALMGLDPGPEPTRPSIDPNTGEYPNQLNPATGEYQIFNEEEFGNQYAEWSRRNEDWQQAQVELKRRQDIKDQIAKQNQERENIFKTQNDEMERLKKAQEDAQAEQQKTIADLASQRDAEMARLSAAKAGQEAAMAQQRQQQEAALAGQRAAQELAITQEQLGTQAVSQSMRVLAMQGAQGAAPTAQQTRGRAATRTRANAATNDLRIGSSGRGSGVGVNIGG